MKQKKKKAVKTHEAELKQMHKLYGTQADEVEINVYATKTEMIEHWGEPCDDYAHGCPLCQAWGIWFSTGICKTSLPREAVIRMLNIESTGGL